jgi:predicted DNA-binding transcriptional regulator AlpA
MTHLELDLSAVLPAPDSRQPCFFGRRFLTARELIATGLVRNHVTLRRLIAEKRFPPPLLIGRKLRVWDVLELQALIDRLAGGKEPAAGQAAGEVSDDDAEADSGLPAAGTKYGGRRAKQFYKK